MTIILKFIIKDKIYIYYLKKLNISLIVTYSIFNINLLIKLIVFINLKSKNYNIILFIIDLLIK